MSREELLAALEREAQHRLEARRTAVAAEITAIMGAAEQERKELQAAAERGWQAEVDAVQRQSLAHARREAQSLLLAAEVRLEQRLRCLAAELLPELACSEACFAHLVAELPPLAWQQLRVHPRDHASVQKFFPVVQVVDDPDLGGGVIAEIAGGRIRVDNTLGTRLQRLWDDLLPPVLVELRRGDAPEDSTEESDAGAAAAP